MRKIPVPWANPTEAVLAVVALLVIIGGVNVFSASFVMAGQELHDSYFFLKKQLLAFVLGMVGLFLAAKFNYRHLSRFVPLMVIATIAMLVAVHYMGDAANGSTRWLKVGIRFQPSEIVKLVAIIMTSVYLGYHLEKGKPISLLSWPLIIISGMCYLVLKQPDMGTAVVIMGACLILYFLSGIPAKEGAALIVFTIAVIAFLVKTAAYRYDRISAWLNPWAYQDSSGYQAVQALLAIGSGRLLGTGLGKGGSKFQYLPEAHTDFAFAVLCQEMGFVGAVVVLILFGMLAWYGAKIAVKAADGFGTMLAAGITFLLVGQAVGNIAMVSGILPVTGIPLPFISYGGTSLVINLVAVGLLVSIARRSGDKIFLSEEGEDQPKPPRLKVVSRLADRCEP
jgi:cell division protein FtsW